MRVRLLIAAFVASALLAGCGVGNGSAITIEKGDPIKVGLVPTADFAPVYIAIERGYFSDAGLNVQTQVMQNAAAIAPSVINGQLQFGAAATTPFVAAAQKGLPLKAVANMADVAVSAALDPSAIIVPGDSDISGPQDLEGRTVAVNALGAIPHVAAAQVIKNAGADPSKVSFVAMPFPDMISALSSGQIDAARVVEPFKTIGTTSGARSIAATYTGTFAASTTFALLFSAQPFLDKNPDVAAKFVAALQKASQDAAADPSLVSDVLVKYAKMDPKVASAIQLPAYSTTLSADALTEASKIMQELGMLPAPVDGAELVWHDQS